MLLLDTDTPPRSELYEVQVNGEHVYCTNETEKLNLALYVAMQTLSGLNIQATVAAVATVKFLTGTPPPDTDPEEKE